MKNILKGELTRSVKIRHSEFITHLFCVQSVGDAKQNIRLVNQEHKSASHNCWAYIVGADGEMMHSSDAGEPSGSAGKPMLRALLACELTNVCAVVSRYFGGVKLGIPGLIEAYSGVVADAVAEVGVEALSPKVRYCLLMSYDRLDSLQHQLKKLGLELIKSEYSDKVRAEVIVPMRLEENFLQILDSLRINFAKQEKGSG